MPSIDLGSLWDRFGVAFIRFGVGLGSDWGQFGVHVESICGRFGVGLGEPYHIVDGIN